MSSPITFTTYLARNKCAMVNATPATAELIDYEGYLPLDFIAACAREFEKRGLARFDKDRMHQHFNYRRAHTYDIIDANGHVLLLMANPATRSWMLQVDDWHEPVHGTLAAAA